MNQSAEFIVVISPIFFHWLTAHVSELPGGGTPVAPVGLMGRGVADRRHGFEQPHGHSFKQPCVKRTSSCSLLKDAFMISGFPIPTLQK